MLGFIQNVPAAAAALRRGVWRLLEVVLHIGAHRTGTTSFQRYMQNNQLNLNKNEIAFWGPKRTRAGLFAGLIGDPARRDAACNARAARSSALIGMEIARLRAAGLGHLVVSEENMIGSMRANLRARALYPGLGARLRRFRAAFSADCSRIVLAVRSYDDYWASAMAYGVPAGFDLPARGGVAALAASGRGWRDVVRDVARAFPAAELVVWDFERLKGHLGAQLALMAGPEAVAAMGAGPDAGAGWHNASMSRGEMRRALRARGAHREAARIAPGEGRFMPFGGEEREAMKTRYAADLAWLKAGADGLARYEDKTGAKTRTDVTPREDVFRDQEERGLGAAG